MGKRGGLGGNTVARRRPNMKAYQRLMSLIGTSPSLPCWHDSFVTTARLEEYHTALGKVSWAAGSTVFAISDSYFCCKSVIHY